MPTPKQEKLIKLLLENLGNPNSTRTLGEMILEAGYSKTMSENPYQILESETVKEGLEDFTKQLTDKRQRAITYLTDVKLEKSEAKDLTDIIDKLTKNIQLLSGGATEKKEMTVVFDEAFRDRKV